MLRRPLQQTYVPTKQNPIPALQTSYLNLPRGLPYTYSACAPNLEQTPSLDLSVEDLDGRWLQIPTAECWELLLSTTYATTPPKTPDNSQRYPSQ